MTSPAPAWALAETRLGSEGWRLEISAVTQERRQRFVWTSGCPDAPLGCLPPAIASHVATALLPDLLVHLDSATSCGWALAEVTVQGTVNVVWSRASDLSVWLRRERTTEPLTPHDVDGRWQISAEAEFSDLVVLTTVTQDEAALGWKAWLEGLPAALAADQVSVQLDHHARRRGPLPLHVIGLLTFCADRPAIGHSMDEDGSWLMTRHLPADTASVPFARASIAAALENWGMADLVFDATLVGTELITNAVLHARTEIVLRMERRHAGVLLAVVDRSPVLPSARDDEFQAELAAHGRGLRIVERLASQWGSAPVEGGKEIWALIAP